MIERWWIRSTDRQPLEERTPLRVAAWMQDGPGRVTLSSDRQSAAVLLEGDGPLLLKWRRPLPGRRRKTFLRASRERREARAMLRALSLGIPCPAPLAVGELRAGGVLEGSILLRGFDAKARSGAAAVQDDPDLLFTIAAAFRGWHELGFRHGDAYPKNVLLGGATEALRPIGCPQAAFVRAGPLLDRRRLKDLAQLAAGAAEIGTHGDPFAYLEAYLAGGSQLPDAAALRAKVEPFFERIMERKRQRIASRPQREPDGPPAPQPLEASFGSKARIEIREMDALS